MLAAMIQIALRWMLPLIALLAVGPLAGMLTASLHAPDGSHAASLLLSTHPLRGVLAGVGVLVLAGAMGLAAARIVSPHYGLFSAGIVLAWGAWGTGTIDAIIRARPAALLPGPSAESATSLFGFLSLEAAILLPLAVALAWLILRIGRRPAPGSPHQPEPTEVRDASAGVGLIAALAVGGVLVWLIAQESNKGQTFAAATIAGVGAAVAGRLAAVRISAAVFVAAIALLAVIAPATALAVHGTGAQPLLAAQGGLLFNLARPLPLDYLAGAFVGVPIGLSWAASMLEQHHHKA